MPIDPLWKVAGDVDMQRSIAFAGHDVYGWLFQVPVSFWIPAFAGMTVRRALRPYPAGLFLSAA